MLANVVLSMGVSLGLVMLFGIFLVFRPSPWYDVRVLLPSIALLLSNTVSGVSLGLSTALKELTTGERSCSRFDFAQMPAKTQNLKSCNSLTFPYGYFSSTVCIIP